jgi:hypothetical protein
MEKVFLTSILIFLAAIHAATAAAAFTLDDIQYWVGTGTNRAAIAIDWSEGSASPPALVWGYRWNGVAHGSDMLATVVKADDRLYAKFGGSAGAEDAIYGLGYDANNDGQFSLDDNTSFDSHGIAYTDPADGAITTNAADYYAEGWFTGFWHYGVASSDPFDGGQWNDSQGGMASRLLTDGAWDSWAIQASTHPPFTTYANNPQAAVSPDGDFNGDHHVDSTDFTLWRTTYGSTTQLGADGNHNGIVDAADYTIWRDHLNGSGAAAITPSNGVPEPSTTALVGSMLFMSVLVEAYVLFRERRARLPIVNSSPQLGRYRS